MEPQKGFKPRKQPEAIIQDKICKKLKGLDWFVKETHGDLYQSGFPDIYAFHRSYGQRWIEVKNPNGYAFTPAQLKWFPMFSAVGCQVWILTSDSDEEYKKLFLPENWYQYLSVWRLKGR
jgi:hypothetical protein